MKDNAPTCVKAQYSSNVKDLCGSPKIICDFSPPQSSLIRDTFALMQTFNLKSIFLLLFLFAHISSLLAQAPTITSFTPISGVVGATVTITGTNFNTTAASNIVYFGATKATVSAATATSLTVTVPSGATCDNISITNSSNNLVAVSLVKFTPTYSLVKQSYTSGDFSAATNFTTGSTTNSIGANRTTIADMDNDGKSDVLVANNSVSSISVLRNIGSSGTMNLATKLDFAVGGNPNSVGVGDIDGDGLLDVVVSNKGNDVSVLINTSSSPTISFASPITITTGNQPREAALADVNSDGKLDLIYENGSGNLLEVRLNTSTGLGVANVSFGAATQLFAGNGTVSVGIGDFDGDGKVDVVSPMANVAELHIWRNTSSLSTVSFVKNSPVLSSISYAWDVEVVDLDGDGKLDLVFSNIQASSVVVLRNTSTVGTISFGSVQTLTASNSTYGVSIGDINGDGKPDIISSKPDVFLNTSTSGTISFASYVALTGASNPISVATGDLDNDGKPDVVVSNTGNTISVYRNNPVLPPTITSFTPTSGVVGTTVTITGTNFNTTAANNIVYFGAIKATVSAATATSLTVTVPSGATFQAISLTNLSTNLTAYSSTPFSVTYSGNLVFTKKGDNTTGTQPFCVNLGDIDGDGKSDLIAPNYGTSNVSVLRNTSSVGVASFATKVDFSTGTNPIFSIDGDVDGDGKIDIITANYGANTMSVLRNTSTSGVISFATKVDFTAGIVPGSVSMGDVDGDGKPDIAVVNSGSNTVSIFRNTSSIGLVSFATKVDFSTGSSPFGGTMGDIDGDGKPDVVVTNQGSNTVSILRNTSSLGTVSFAAKIDFATGVYPFSATMGDIDGDGKSEVVVSNFTSSTVSVLRNISTVGIISFNAKVDYAVGSSPRNISIADIDGDGKSDIAVANDVAISVSILRNISNSGSVNLVSPIDYSSGATGSPTAVALGDIDGDNKVDIAMSNKLNNVVSVFLQVIPVSITSFSPTSGVPGTTVTIAGTGFNTTAANNVVYFGATKATVSAATATSLTVTVPSGATLAPITVLNLASNLSAYSLNNFMPIFSPAKTNISSADFPTKLDFATGTNPNSVVVGDIDGDGKADLLTPNYNAGTISILRNTATSGSIGSGSFATKVDFSTGTNPNSIAIGDLDGDGKLDVAVVNVASNTVSVLRNTATSGSITAGSLAAKQDFSTGGAPQAVEIGDLDGDGKPELVVVSAGNTVSIFRNTTITGTINASSFATAVNFTTGSTPWSVAIGDLDGDGKPDLAVTNSQSASVSVFRNTSTTGSITTGSFAAKQDFGIVANGGLSIKIGDIDGDGKPDLVIPCYNSTAVSVLRNTATSGSIVAGSFAAKQDFAITSGPFGGTIADLDGDGKLDLIAGNNGASTVSVLRNTASSGSIVAGSFAAKVDFVSSLGTFGLAAGDLDGDGKPELVVANYNISTVSIFRNTEVSSNANLSALTTTAGTIAPTFAAATTAYTVSVANATASVTVTPTKADANATIQVRVNGGTYTTVASGVASSALALNVGANPIDIQVTAQDGTTIKTYTITVTRAPSTVATLSAMTLSSGTLSPTFASATTSYTASLTSSKSTITVTPTSSNSGATIQVQVNGGGYSTVTSGSASDALALNFGVNTVQVKVTAQDGTTIITYTTSVTRANYTAITNNGDWNTASTWDGNAVPPTGADVIINATGVTLSTNVTVKSITVNTGKSITHSSNTLTVQTGGFITNNGTFTSTATVDFSGAATVSGIVSFSTVYVRGAVNFGSNSTVDGLLFIYYGGSVVNRPIYGNTSGLFYTGAGTIFVGNEWPTGNINLGSLYVSSGTVLDFGTISTSRQVGAGRGTDIYQNDGTINLSSVSGGDLILESVYLYNAGTLNTNQRTVTIQGGSNHHIQNAGSGITFYNLVFGAGGSINVPLTVTNNLNLTAGCTMDISGTGSVTLESGATNTGSGRLNMGNGNGFVKIKNITTARTFPLARGGFSSTYTPLTISNGQGLDYTVKMNSTNPSGGTLSAYTAARTFTGQWDITPSSAPASPVTLAFQYNNGDLLAGTSTQNQVLTHYVGGQWTEVTGNVATPTGTNPYTVSFAYSGTFSPFSFGGAPSTNADLSALTTTAGTIAPTFASATTSYTASVANATASVTVTPTKADANATIQVRVNGGTYATVASGAASSALALNAGANTIEVLVTAEDGTTIKTYSISVCRSPIASISGNNGPICFGSDATFTLTGTSGATVTYNLNGGSNTTATLTGGTANITLTAAATNQTLNLVDVSHTGCTNALSGNSTVVVNTPSVAPTSISGTSTICNGSSTTLTAVGGTLGTSANYQWGTGSVVGTNPLAGETAVTLTISPSSTTTYWVRIENTASACATTTTGLTQAVTVNTPSVAPTSISGTSTICNGSSTTLTAVGGTLGTSANYQWGTGSVVGTNPLAGETAATLTISPTSTTTYWVRIENTTAPCIGTTNGLTQVVTVNPLPTVSITANNSPVCSGADATFTLTGTTDAVVSYNLNGTAGTATLTGGTAAITATSVTSDRILVLMSVNNPITNCSQSITGTSTVTVNTTPTVSATPASQSICPSGTITDIALTNPNSVLGTVFIWSRDNTTVLTGMGNTGTGASISGSLASTTPNTFFTTTFTITATANGCSSNTTAAVSVGDNTAPVADVTTLLNITGECGATAIAPTATDNCVGSVTATTTDPLSYSAQGTYTIHWTYNDGNGNTSTQNQTVIVDDVTAPVADVASLPNVTGECGATATAPTATDNCVGSVTATTTDPLSYSAQGTYTIHWTYNDGNGNTSTQNQMVIVDDVTAPVADVASLPNITGECGATATAPTATDNCVGSVTATTSDPLSYSAQGTYTIHWTYNDGNGNISTQNQTVIVDDVTAPVADVTTLLNVTGECGATATAPTATDNCVGSVTATTTDPLSYSSQGIYTIHWTYNDGNGNTSTQNQTVIVDDVTAPVVDVASLPNITGECGATAIAPTATDNCVGSVTATTTDPLSYSSQGTYTIHWTYNDGNGNTSTQTQTVIVDDVTAPVADVTTLLNITGECGATATAPTATDNCVGSVTATTTDPLSYSVQGTYTIHWTYNDGNGNTSTQNQTVIVDDVTAPAAVCNPLSVTLNNTTGDYTLNAANLSAIGLGSNDNCTAAGNLSFSAMPNNFNCITLGAQTVVLTVNDGNGNNATCNATVTVNNYVTASAGTDTTICDNLSVVLSGAGMGGAGTYNYAWTPSATLTGAATSTPTATPVTNQTYILTVTDPFGCSATSTVEVNVISAPSAPISGGNKCGFSANSATLELAVTGTNVEWYNNNNHSGASISTSTTYTATTTGTYYAYQVAGNGCYSNPTALTATIRTSLPTAIPTGVGMHLATDEVVNSGWSHYCDCPNNELLLSLQQGVWDPGDLVNNLNPTSGQYAIRTDVGASALTNLTTAPYNSDLTGWQVISRTWDVVLNNAGQEPNANGVASVGVRSYFTQADFDAINVAFATPLSSPSKLTIYKLDSITAPTGSLYASSMAALQAGHLGIDKNHIQLYNNQTPYLPDWTYLANNVASDIHAAEISVTEFSGGGGGGGNNGGAPFPISLTKFDGYNENVSNRLFWTTESELNADKFIVERSNDNTVFTVLGEVIALGNSATVQNYTFNDRTFNAKDNFYRLKMLDKDGTFAYSKVIEITTNKLSVTIYPNPAQNEVFIAGNFPANAKVSLSNMLGQEVLKMNLEVNNQTAVSLQNVSQGVYMLNILNEKGVIMHTEKLVRE